GSAPRRVGRAGRRAALCARLGRAGGPKLLLGAQLLERPGLLEPPMPSLFHDAAPRSEAMDEPSVVPAVRSEGRCEACRRPSRGTMKRLAEELSEPVQMALATSGHGGHGGGTKLWSAPAGRGRRRAIA